MPVDSKELQFLKELSETKPQSEDRNAQKLLRFLREHAEFGYSAQELCKELKMSRSVILSAYQKVKDQIEVTKDGKTYYYQIKNTTKES